MPCSIPRPKVSFQTSFGQTESNCMCAPPDASVWRPNLIWSLMASAHLQPWFEQGLMERRFSEPPCRISPQRRLMQPSILGVPSLVSWGLAYQHISSPGSKIPSCKPRSTTLCWGKSRGLSASSGKDCPPFQTAGVDSHPMSKDPVLCNQFIISDAMHAFFC